MDEKERVIDLAGTRVSATSFLESLQGFASMCESGAITPEDGQMLADKFRNAAAVIAMQQAALSARPAPPANLREVVAKAVEPLFQTNAPFVGKTRLMDLAYTAFTLAKAPNDEDGGPSDWFNDTLPVLVRLVEMTRVQTIDAVLTAIQAHGITLDGAPPKKTCQTCRHDAAGQPVDVGDSGSPCWDCVIDKHGENGSNWEESEQIAARDALSDMRAALRAIAEGNLGDTPWQANYIKIRTFAQSALDRANGYAITAQKCTDTP